jgi:hypothetical protein
LKIARRGQSADARARLVRGKWSAICAFAFADVIERANIVSSQFAAFDADHDFMHVFF